MQVQHKAAAHVAATHQAADPASVGGHYLAEQPASYVLLAFLAFGAFVMWRFWRWFFRVTR